MNIDAIQDFEEAAGLVNYLMDNALDEVAFEWTPLTADGTKYAGTVQIVPMEIGGDVAVQVVTSVELPLVGEPTRTDGVDDRWPRRARRQGGVIRLTGTIEYDGGRSEHVRDRRGRPRRMGALRAAARLPDRRQGAADAVQRSSSPITRSASRRASTSGGRASSDVEMEARRERPSYPAGSFRRLMVELAMALERPLAELEQLGDVELATVVDVLEERRRRG